MSVGTIRATFLLVIYGVFNVSFSYAGECNGVQLLKNKSPGTYVLKNKCAEDRLALGSQLELSPGARLWLKNTYNRDSIQQVICQNRTPQTVHLNILNPHSPWLKVANIAQCDKWVNGRLKCQLSKTQQFFCVTGTLNTPKTTHKRQERTTSVSMRGMSKDLLLNRESGAHYMAKVIKNIQPDVRLCRELFASQETVELIWRISRTGKMGDMSILTDSEADLTACIRDVVADYKYPRAPETVTFIHEF